MITAAWLFEHRPYAKMRIPLLYPPVVFNALVHSGIQFGFMDNIYWMGGAWELGYDNGAIIDSAQEVSRRHHAYFVGQNPCLCRLYSFYPTKPVGGLDGGMICTGDEEVATYCRMAG
jgi:hypothetical protein